MNNKKLQIKAKIRKLKIAIRQEEKAVAPKGKELSKKAAQAFKDGNIEKYEKLLKAQWRLYRKFDNLNAQLQIQDHMLNNF